MQSLLSGAGEFLQCMINPFFTLIILIQFYLILQALSQYHK